MMVGWIGFGVAAVASICCGVRYEEACRGRRLSETRWAWLTALMGWMFAANLCVWVIVRTN